jgi:hypothetical protein
MNKKEEALFLHLKENHYPEIEFSEDKYCRYDCEDDDRVIEIKCRNKHYPTMIIERSKYNALIDVADERGVSPLYINSTPEGIFEWNLSDVEIEWKVETKHPATTHFSNNNRVAKEVGYLDINEAKVLE